MSKSLRERVWLDVATAVDDLISINDCTDHIVENIMSKDDKAILMQLLTQDLIYWNNMTKTFPHDKAHHEELIAGLEGVMSRL